jgi:hypothetical protein
LKRSIGERYLLWFGLAVGLDAILVFGPPALPPSPLSFPLLLSRWLVMIIGVWSVFWAFGEARIEHRRRYWLSVYLIVGFTLAGLLNGSGTLRLPIF